MNALRRLVSCGLVATCALATPARSRPLEDILASGTFDICVQEDSAPFSDQTSGTGIFIDLGRLIAQHLGVQLTETWLFSAEYARKTSCDALPAVADIPGDDPLRLTIPYLKVRTALVTRAGAPPVKTLADIAKGRVAVLANSYARHDLNKRGINLSVAFLENKDVLAAVDHGDDNAGVVTLFSLEWYVHQNDALLRANLEPLGEVYDYDAAIGLRHADPPLLKKINVILQTSMRDGTLANIFEKYGLQYEPPK